MPESDACRFFDSRGRWCQTEMTRRRTMYRWKDAEVGIGLGGKAERRFIIGGVGSAGVREKDRSESEGRTEAADWLQPP